MGFNPDDYDPGPIRFAGRRGADPLEISIAIWQATVDRFFRRRRLAWTVWLGLWTVPGALLAALAAKPSLFDFGRNRHVVWWVSLGIAVFLWLMVLWWTFATASAHRRDHAQGFWWNYRIARRMRLGVLPEPSEVRKEAGRPRVTLDLWVPFLITTVFYWAAVLLLLARIKP